MRIEVVVRRILWALPVLWLIATLTFVMMHVVPGGPFDREKKLPPAIKANVEAKYHLDEPISHQYFLYLQGLLHGELGPSYKYLGRTVNDIISETFPVSASLGLLALTLAIFVGISVGILSALFAHSPLDRLGMFCVTAGISAPNFVVGSLLLLVFSHHLKWLPPALWEDFSHALLPAVTLSFAPAAYIARLTRASLIEVYREDYVRTARAKGLSEGVILLRHVLKNAITPVVTMLGPLTASLITGSFIIEFIFSIPGMGKFFITAVTNRDYPLIMGVTLVYAVLIVIANLAVDLFYTLIDPKVEVAS